MTTDKTNETARKFAMKKRDEWLDEVFKRVDREADIKVACAVIIAIGYILLMGVFNG